MTYTHATAHVGPRGGTEYRLHTPHGTYLVVGKFKALPYMSEDAKAHAATLDATRKAKTANQSQAAQDWRDLMRGG